MSNRIFLWFYYKLFCIFLWFCYKISENACIIQIKHIPLFLVSSELYMIRIEEIQSIGAFTMAVFAMAVALSPRRKVMGKEKEYNIMKRSRWMLFSALIILSVHYVLQRIFGFRHMGELQGPLLNFLLYTPSVLLMNLTTLNILRFGKIKRWEYGFGIAVCLTQIASFAIAGIASGKGVLVDSTELMVAEYFSSAISTVMLVIYIMITRREYKEDQGLSRPILRPAAAGDDTMVCHEHVTLHASGTDNADDDILSASHADGLRRDNVRGNSFPRDKLPALQLKQLHADDHGCRGSGAAGHCLQGDSDSGDDNEREGHHAEEGCGMARHAQLSPQRHHYGGGVAGDWRLKTGRFPLPPRPKLQQDRLMARRPPHRRGETNDAGEPEPR